MELLLNLAWMLVAGSLMCLWLRGARGSAPDQRRQLIAILVLIAILFPVISVSDDLLAVQNAYEADNYLRRNHMVPGTYPVQPAIAITVAFVFTGLGFAFLRFVAPGVLPVKALDHPELAGIANRPPPAA
jgi:hypothetical protein